METTTAPTAPLATCEPDEDFGLCDLCERTTLEPSYCRESGTITCEECENAYHEEMARACRGISVPLTYEQLRRDHEEVIAMCGYGSDEVRESAMVLARMT